MQRPFRFGLERVRDLRTHDETRAKEAFANGLSDRARGAALLAGADDRLATAHVVGRGTFDAAAGTDLLRRQAWVERLERNRADAALRLDALDLDLERRRGTLTEASRRREALDRLRERQAGEHAADAARREGAQLDEIALRGHARRAAA